MPIKYYIHTQNKEFVEKYFFNEYRLVDEPCFGYEICIGRRSGGWKPLFNQHNDAYTSVEEMKEFLSIHSDKISIYDESERFITLNELEEVLNQYSDYGFNLVSTLIAKNECDIDVMYLFFTKVCE